MSKYFSDCLQELQNSAAQSEWSFRRDALRLFQAYGMPRRKQDPWKYVDNSRLLNLEEDLVDFVQGSLQHENTDGIVFYNDQLHGNLGQNGTIRNLSFAEDLQREPQRWNLDVKSLESEHNSYSLMNAFSFEQAYLIEVAPQVLGDIYLNFCGTVAYQCPRLYVHIPEKVQVNILLDTRGIGSNTYWNPYLYFQIGRGAKVQIIQCGPALTESKHVRSVTLRGDVAAEAHLDSALFYWGMDLAIHDARFALNGEQIEASMRGICFAEGSSAYHLRGEQQHLSPHSRSHSLYKNVLFDRASTEFYGIIHAARNSVGTDAKQKNQNLLLSEQARAISRPQLEIHNDDLQCSHGSSTGSIDPEELFYMRSRGLDQNLAVRMAVVGFVEEICTYFDAALLERLGIRQCLQTLLSKRNI